MFNLVVLVLLIFTCIYIQTITVYLQKVELLFLDKKQDFY